VNLSQMSELAQLFVDKSGVRGLAWKTHVGRESYLGELATAQDGALAAVRKYQLTEGWTNTPRQAARAIEDIKKRIDERQAEVWDAVKSMRWVLAYDQAVEFERETLREIIGNATKFAADGAAMHYDGIMLEAGQQGLLTREQIKDHADDCARIFRTVTKMDKEGDLDKLALPALGAPQLVIIAIVGILAVVALVAVYVWLSRMAEAQKLAYETCKELARKGQSSAAVRCVAEAGPLTKSDPFGFGAFGKQVGYMVGLGALAYISVRWVVPAAAARLAARREARR